MITLITCSDSCPMQFLRNNLQKVWINLRTYRLEVQYYPKKLKNELKKYDSLHQFDNDFSQEGLFDCKLHGKVGEEDSIAALEDLAKFCREK
ncbi:hypothetical protein M3234_17795 [Neobacillus niacini]|nr:hypothetical protein [Neobacillus niacini]